MNALFAAYLRQPRIFHATKMIRVHRRNQRRLHFPSPLMRGRLTFATFYGNSGEIPPPVGASRQRLAMPSARLRGPSALGDAQRAFEIGQHLDLAAPVPLAPLGDRRVLDLG